MSQFKVFFVEVASHYQEIDRFKNIFKPLSTFLQPALLINLSNIKHKFSENAENRIQDCWVRSKNATSVLYSPPPRSRLKVWKFKSLCVPKPSLLGTILESVFLQTILCLIVLSNLRGQAQFEEPRKSSISSDGVYIKNPFKH